MLLSGEGQSFCPKRRGPVGEGRLVAPSFGVEGTDSDDSAACPAKLDGFRSPEVIGFFSMIMLTKVDECSRSRG